MSAAEPASPAQAGPINAQGGVERNWPRSVTAYCGPSRSASVLPYATCSPSHSHSHKRADPLEQPLAPGNPSSARIAEPSARQQTRYPSTNRSAWPHLNEGRERRPGLMCVCAPGRGTSNEEPAPAGAGSLLQVLDVSLVLTEQQGCLPDCAIRCHRAGGAASQPCAALPGACSSAHLAAVSSRCSGQGSQAWGHDS